MISKTISITIPEKLENDLQNKADEIGISRSRFIGNILLDWQTKINASKQVNDCINQLDGFCTEFSILCQAPQKEAETCADYNPKNK